MDLICRLLRIEEFQPFELGSSSVVQRWMSAPVIKGWFCAAVAPGCVIRHDAASPWFIDILAVNLGLLLQRDMGTVVTFSQLVDTLTVHMVV